MFQFKWSIFVPNNLLIHADLKVEMVQNYMFSSLIHKNWNLEKYLFVEKREGKQEQDKPITKEFYFPKDYKVIFIETNP